jgi:cardiolipin synthase
LQGPAVQRLALTFFNDWMLESRSPVDWQREALELAAGTPTGETTLQVLPSGPDRNPGGIAEVVLTALYAAESELVLTTPYFVPEESMLTALKSAAYRGVQVTLIVPEKVDSRLTQYASRAHQPDLLAAGVRIALYQGGLLHTKSITVDGEISLFGSLNLDPRSLRLDFEITLAIFDRSFTAELRQLQATYLERSQWLELETCLARSPMERFKEDTARLVGPLL